MIEEQNKSENVEQFIAALQEALPPVFARHRLTKLSGGLINSRTIANLMSLGQGPPGIRVGKNVGHSRESFIAWLRERKIEEIGA